jgi:transposase
MNPDTKYHGVDVSKSYLDLDGLDHPRRFPNTPEGCAQLFAALSAHAHLVCEASGGYERTLCAAAWAAARPISLVGGDRVRAFARSVGCQAKTDRLDASLLTRYATERRPKPIAAPDETIARLRAHLRAREHVLELHRAEANHREHLADLPLLRAQSDARLQGLDAQLAELAQAIAELVASQPKLARRAERLQQVKGVGKITAWTVCADLPELGTLQPGQAAALSGLAPYARDSGDKIGRRFIARGRSTLRRVLHMAAVTASIHNPKLREVYARLKTRGKPSKVALVAIARRLIEFLNHIVKYPDFCLAS